MALFPVNDFFIFNGEIKPISEFVGSENDGGIYEVIRVKNGIPLFLEDHISRFYKSAEIAKIPVTFSATELKDFVNILIKKNNATRGNLLISYKLSLKLFFIAHKYPTPGNYNEGVECGVLFTERKNPNAKVFQTFVRQKANKLISKNDIYEVLLVDDFGRVTEGSRSNVFFVKNNLIVTPPAANVLLGITRKKTIELIRLLKINFLEKEILLDEISDYDAMFITGTSPEILPVNRVKETGFNPQNNIIQSLITEYNSMVNEYIKNNIKD